MTFPKKPAMMASLAFSCSSGVNKDAGFDVFADMYWYPIALAKSVALCVPRGYHVEYVRPG